MGCRPGLVLRRTPRAAQLHATSTPTPTRNWSTSKDAQNEISKTEDDDYLVLVVVISGSSTMYQGRASTADVDGSRGGEKQITEFGKMFR